MTTVDPIAPTTATDAQWDAVDSLPDAIALCRRFIRYEHWWSRTHLAPIAPDEHRQQLAELARYEQVLDAALVIWRLEDDAMRARVAARLEEQVPAATGYGITDAVRYGNYAKMRS